ncbi:glycyl-radical enzyme activating protein [Mailhella massiliensis]|uniref:Glycyl-radical enzyme activating protein n=1 Tax=Mailhella massiliensis TaxID=1903261 RepID=A0A921DRH5_9BACT|nr:glycyl-radical enzyme activating protein [Mailhella massiliensis]HJD96948.1 glycyl-radical enzyme activating protein [Mailhella massiliensis]
MSQGTVYNIQRMSTKDGPGIRTTVFLKGCPLHCLWCSNPESQSFVPELLFFRNLCTGCGACVASCPAGAAVQEEGISGLDRSRCLSCGACAAVCPTKAREMSGRLMSVEEVLAVLRKDALFYENSGGGVTFGGGEPTAAGQFFLDLVEASVMEGWHVTVDTCGFCPEERFRKALAMADLFLFDVKHMDPVRHRELTGQDNALILRNMEAALLSGREVRIRMPLMPGLNDSEENIAAMADFFGKFGRSEIEIMPCHAFGRNKYAALSLPFPAVGQYTPEALQHVRERFAGHGLSTVIV